MQKAKVISSRRFRDLSNLHEIKIDKSFYYRINAVKRRFSNQNKDNRLQETIKIEEKYRQAAKVIREILWIAAKLSEEAEEGDNLKPKRKRQKNNQTIKEI
jgi:hypothetical protein